MVSFLQRIGIGTERRRYARLRLPVVILASVGRQQATLVDISPGGACVQGLSPLKRDEIVRFTLRFRALFLEAKARVRRATVIALRPTTTYEFRLEFLGVAGNTAAAIEEFMRQAGDIRLRHWTRTPEGYTRDTGTPREVLARFRQLVRSEAGWEEILTFEPDQPEDGMTIPSSTPTTEIRGLCEAYDSGDEDARAEMRAKAALACSVIAESDSRTS